MTYISAIKSPIVLKMVSNGGYGNIIPSCTTVFKSFDFLFEEYQQNFLNLKKKYGKIMGVYIEKTDISWLLKNLESHIWYQMIASTMFYNHVISNIKHQLLLLYVY